MLVLPEAKALVLKLKNPNKVLGSIPTAKPHTLGGVPIVAVPHRLDETKVLNNLGIKAPSPILHGYNWPGTFTPFEHQRQTAAFLTLHHRGLVLNEIGTGKTQAALWALDYLMQVKAIKRVLILSPLSTLERVWGDALYTGFLHRKAVVLHGTAEKRLSLMDTEADFFICNHDGFPIIADKAMGAFDIVLVDEATVLRNQGTKRFRLFYKWLLANPSVGLWLMTGTPTPNSPLDAWALSRLVGNPNCPRSYVMFRDQVMVKTAAWKYTPRKEAAGIVKNILQPAIRYTRDECFDLPDTVVQTRRADLTPKQKTYYTQMLRHFVVRFASGEEGPVTAVNEAVKLQKLIQIACGVVYNTDGEQVIVDCLPRVNLVREVIREAGGKVIVFAPLTGVIRMLGEELAKDWEVGIINGEVPTKARNEIFRQFQNEEHPHILLAHPGTMAHGLTLTTATTIIWYGPINSNETYTQANGRIERIGKKRSSTVVHIEATDLEHKIYTRLRNKQALQGLLLDYIQEETARRQS